MHSVRDDRGAAAVELGLLLPLLLLILFGIIDFGRMYHAQVTLTQAAREGARLAAFAEAEDEVVARAEDAATGLDRVSASISSSCPGTDGIVSVSYGFEFVTPVGAIGSVFAGGGYGDPITLSAEGVMPCES